MSSIRKCSRRETHQCLLLALTIGLGAIDDLALLDLRLDRLLRVHCLALQALGFGKRSYGRESGASDAVSEVGPSADREHAHRELR